MSRYDELVKWAKDGGLPITPLPFDPSYPFPEPVDLRGAGLPYHHDGDTFLNGMYCPENTAPDGREQVVVTFPSDAPEWLKTGILSHELGHYINRHAMAPERYGENGKKKLGKRENYVEEVEASYRAYELLTELGIPIDEYVIGVLNYSMGPGHAKECGISKREAQSMML